MKCVSLGACLGPMQEMGMNLKHQGTVIAKETLRYLFLNSSKSKTHMKSMKLDMLSWNGTRHAVVKKMSHLEEIWVIRFSQTKASHNKPDGFGRERATLGDKKIYVASSCFQNFSSVNIERQECCVNFWDFWGSLGHFYTLTGFSRHFMCIIQI